MATLIDPAELPWQPVRAELTSGVTGKLLLDGATKMVLTRVVAKGVFRPHRDRYGHLFYILAGQALMQVEQQSYRLSGGMSLQVEAGELHGYQNCADEDLLLLSTNLPVS